MPVKENYFPQRKEFHPKIYAYSETNPQYKGYLKVGYTTKDVRERVQEQFPTLRPGESPYKIVLEEDAIRNDGTTFTDKDVHRMLESMSVKRLCNSKKKKTEWFACEKEIVLSAIENVRCKQKFSTARTKSFAMRPEQKEAVERTYNYFRDLAKEENGKIPRFLWNCKMRFGKTFASYQLAKKMGWTKLLILTFKPAVEDAWEEDLLTHKDFEGWQFVSSHIRRNSNAISPEDVDKTKPFVCFGSFQDYLGKNDLGGIKSKNEWVHAINWDCVVLDEYHYGAWNENSQKLFAKEGEDLEEETQEDKLLDSFDQDLMPITTNYYLYLSGTPFRALKQGEFMEEQIYSWTYSDEQKAKEEWDNTKGDNPYISLPKLIMMTYQLPEDIVRIAEQGVYNEFDLNTFFSAKGEGDKAEFVFKDEVQKWLNIIRGAYKETIVSDLKLKENKPPMPFSHAPLLQLLTHTLWLFHNVNSCYAMRNLLKEKQNVFYHDYKIILAAGKECGTGIQPLEYLRQEMDDPLKTKTITLSCGKLTTGVTVKPWSGIFMLCNLSSPETYFQAAFRVQSPWTINNPDDLHPNKEEIQKEIAYIFDFAPNRALRQIADYSSSLNLNDETPEKKVGDFISFLPILAYDGSSMKELDAGQIMDWTVSGTTATLLAKKWQSALLVNVTNDVLQKLLKDKDALNALTNIEMFRGLNLKDDLQTIINKSEKVKKLKKENKKDQSKRELTQEEKEYKSKRKEIQEKLIKFATRIPIFMYLTDYREQTLTDVIRKLEPKLFKRVTGLEIEDFDNLVKIGVFNYQKMNDAIYYFRRYEDSSLEYTGINKHEDEQYIGGFDTSISKEEYSRLK